MLKYVVREKKVYGVVRRNSRGYFYVGPRVNLSEKECVYDEGDRTTLDELNKLNKLSKHPRIADINCFIFRLPENDEEILFIYLKTEDVEIVYE